MLNDIKNSVFRDNIAGNRLIEVPWQIRKVIDTQEFQRLRNIRQMGLSSYVFPTTEHSRFTHSLGVYATAKQVFLQLQRRSVPLDLHFPGIAFDQELEHDFCLAALCHDIGHTAFSHVLETTLLPNDFRSHEACTLALLTSDSKIGEAISDVADLDSVVLMYEKSHPNKALNDLISGPFDVDRCDYIIRDGAMSGVEYGNYDLNWLIHSITLERNSNGQPVLLLDGPRGLDALRQFLSARRYMHRQVYFHPSIRGAQILLKGIFERVQDIGDHTDTAALAPMCLHALMRREKPTIDDFVQTTDIEVLYMVRNFASNHSDEILRLLCDMFQQRHMPKCIIDSAKSRVPLGKRYRLAHTPSGEDLAQAELWDDRADIESFTESVRDFVADRLQKSGAPAGAANYLVSFESVPYTSTPPTDFLFSYRGEVVPLEEIDPFCVGFDLSELMESFSIQRLFAPRGLANEVKEFVETEYCLSGT